MLFSASITSCNSAENMLKGHYGPSSYVNSLFINVRNIIETYINRFSQSTYMISEENLLNLLDAWNLWSHDVETGVERTQCIKRIKPLLERKEILIIKGIRRSGKSTIMRQIMKHLLMEGIGKEQLLYLNMEDYNLKDSLQLGLLEKTLKVYEENIKKNGKTYFFIDEVQMIPEWERFLRTLYDLKRDIKFIVSGSNASLLSKELATKLTGRNLTIQIRTLNFSEFRDFKKKADIDEFFTYGGFPEVVLERDVSKKKILLQQYFEDIINKDVLARHSIRNSEVVFDLARYLIENSGRKQSMNKLSKALGIDDKTAHEYISYMIDAYLIIKVPFFSYSVKKRFNRMTQPKYYSADNGFMQITSLHFTDDLGKFFENAVLLEIAGKANDVAYWSDKSEVDFVYERRAVNATIAKEVPKREFDGLSEFRQKHKQFEVLVVSKKGTVANTDINTVSFRDFSSELALP